MDSTKNRLVFAPRQYTLNSERKLFILLHSIVTICTITNVVVAAKLTSDVLEVDYVDLKRQCEPHMYEDAKDQMCQPELPHVTSLTWSAVTGGKRAQCQPHNNNRIEFMNGTVPAGFPGYVSGCCVQVCKVKRNLVGYMVSGMQKADEETGVSIGSMLDDDRCPFCWGIATFRKAYDHDGWNKFVCKERESWSDRKADFPAQLVSKLPPCVDIEFTDVKGKTRLAPSWVINNQTRREEPKDPQETKSPEETKSPGETESPEETKGPGDNKDPGDNKKPGDNKGPGGNKGSEDKESKVLWIWLGPLLAALVAGVFSLCAARLERRVHIVAANASIGERDGEEVVD